MEMKLRTGDSIAATVERVEHYGVYFTYSREQILVLIPELSWGYGFDPKEKFKVGESHRVEILRHVPEKQIFLGSIRKVSAEDNPYLNLVNSPPGVTFQARICEIFGGIASLEILDLGIPATMAQDRLPEDLKNGAMIETRVVSVDPEKGRAELDFVRAI